MELLEKRIREQGRVLPGGVLKIDSFLNHQIDPGLMYEMALEVKRLYEGEEITKVLTIEASGIALAIMVAHVLGAPMVFAKKFRSSNISDDVYKAEIPSFTHGNVNTAVVSKDYLNEGDKVLIVDDFLATGAALIGLSDICRQAGAEVVGTVAAVEKAHQGGEEKLKEQGIRVDALARIVAMDENGVTFG